jgi:hypothetical protein
LIEYAEGLFGVDARSNRGLEVGAELEIEC